MQDQLRNGEEKTTRRPSQNQQLRPDGHKVCERVARVAPRSVVCALCTENTKKRRKCFGGETETESGEESREERMWC